MVIGNLSSENLSLQINHILKIKPFKTKHRPHRVKGDCDLIFKCIRTLASYLIINIKI